MKVTLTFLAGSFWFLFVASSYAQADHVRDCPLLEPVPKGVAVSFIAQELTSGKVIAECHSDLALVPASVLKIIPGIIALKMLGPEFKFKTQVSLGTIKGARVLAIKGGGDPSLTIESLWLLIRKLKMHGVDRLDEVVLDDSRFSDSRGRVGQRAYQTGGGALSFNYNSVEFNVCPSTIGKRASVLTDPEEFPVELSGAVRTVPGAGGVFAIDEDTATKSGAPRFLIRGTIGFDRSCERIYRSISEPLDYLKRTLAELLKVSGIKFNGKINIGLTPSRSQLLFEHESKPLGQVLQDLNQYSNNFIAEQVLFYLDDLSQPRLSRSRGLLAMSRFATELKFSNYHFEDGSGLDRRNKVSAALLGAALLDAAIDPNIAPDFEQSLSVAGRSGTLRKRPLPGVVFRGKTGTLDGVSSIVGYLTTTTGRKLALALIINGSIAKEVAVALEDRVILRLNS